jgi:hypothetical protein
MGVNIEHPDGSTQVVRVPGEYALRLVEHFTLDEIRSLVTAIAGEVLAMDLFEKRVALRWRRTKIVATLGPASSDRR